MARRSRDVFVDVEVNDDLMRTILEKPLGSPIHYEETELSNETVIQFLRKMIEHLQDSDPASFACKVHLYIRSTGWWTWTQDHMVQIEIVSRKFNMAFNDILSCIYNTFKEGWDVWNDTPIYYGIRREFQDAVEHVKRHSEVENRKGRKSDRVEFSEVSMNLQDLVSLVAARSLPTLYKLNTFMHSDVSYLEDLRDESKDLPRFQAAFLVPYVVPEDVESTEWDPCSLLIHFYWVFKCLFPNFGPGPTDDASGRRFYWWADLFAEAELCPSLSAAAGAKVCVNRHIEAPTLMHVIKAIDGDDYLTEYKGALWHHDPMSVDVDTTKEKIKHAIDEANIAGPIYDLTVNELNENLFIAMVPKDCQRYDMDSHQTLQNFQGFTCSAEWKGGSDDLTMYKFALMASRFDLPFVYAQLFVGLDVLPADESYAFVRLWCLLLYVTWKRYTTAENLPLLIQTMIRFETGEGHATTFLIISITEMDWLILFFDTSSALFFGKWNYDSWMSTTRGQLEELFRKLSVVTGVQYRPQFQTCHAVLQTTGTCGMYSLFFPLDLIRLHWRDLQEYVMLKDRSTGASLVEQWCRKTYEFSPQQKVEMEKRIIDLASHFSRVYSAAPNPPASFAVELLKGIFLSKARRQACHSATDIVGKLRSNEMATAWQNDVELRELLEQDVGFLSLTISERTRSKASSAMQE